MMVQTVLQMYHTVLQMTSQTQGDHFYQDDDVHGNLLDPTATCNMLTMQTA